MLPLELFADGEIVMVSREQIRFSSAVFGFNGFWTDTVEAQYDALRTTFTSECFTGTEFWIQVSSRQF